ncbi:SRPBCC family protein [bacterium]|nr:SRPBCC family protein [bacterium]
MAEGTVRSTVTRASAETVFGVAADLEAYPEWATGVNSVEVLDRDAEGRASRARFEVEGFIKRITYELEYEYDPPQRIAWTAVPGDDIREMEGSYEFSEEDGDAIEILYALRVETAFSVPGFLRRQAEKQIVTSALRELKRRAEAIEEETG